MPLVTSHECPPQVATPLKDAYPPPYGITRADWGGHLPSGPQISIDINQSPLPSEDQTTWRDVPQVYAPAVAHVEQTTGLSFYSQTYGQESYAPYPSSSVATGTSQQIIFPRNAGPANFASQFSKGENPACGMPHQEQAAPDWTPVPNFAPLWGLSPPAALNAESAEVESFCRYLDSMTPPTFATPDDSLATYGRPKLEAPQDEEIHPYSFPADSSFSGGSVDAPFTSNLPPFGGYHAHASNLPIRSTSSGSYSLLPSFLDPYTGNVYDVEPSQLEGRNGVHNHSSSKHSGTNEFLNIDVDAEGEVDPDYTADQSDPAALLNITTIDWPSY